MFQINQWVTSIFELLLRTGSGSWNSRTKLCVPIGTCDHFSSGETAIGPAFCVYLSGMTPPSSNAVVVINNGGACRAASAASALTCAAALSHHGRSNCDQRYKDKQNCDYSRHFALHSLFFSSLEILQPEFYLPPG